LNRRQAAFVVLLLASLSFLPVGTAFAQEVEEVERVSPLIGTQPLKRLALIPVVVHSSEDPGYLREGLRDMLVSRLEQGGNLEVKLVGDPSRATTDVDEALATARELDADFVLFGSFTRFGQGASLDMQCAATEGVDGLPPLRQIFVHSGDIASMIPDLDELVGKVARFVGQFGAEVAAGAPPAAPSASEFDDGNASGAGPGAGPSTRELLLRVEALESEVRALRTAAESP
jgi:hypothetical protein